MEFPLFLASGSGMDTCRQVRASPGFSDGAGQGPEGAAETAKRPECKESRSR